MKASLERNITLMEAFLSAAAFLITVVGLLLATHERITRLEEQVKTKAEQISEIRESAREAVRLLTRTREDLIRIQAGVAIQPGQRERR